MYIFPVFGSIIFNVLYERSSLKVVDGFVRELGVHMIGS